MPQCTFKQLMIRSISFITLLWLSSYQLACADFYHAFLDYQAGKFAEASAQFHELAELGDGPSQFNLGAMAIRGEGMDKDAGTGVGWMLAAAENGYTQVSREKLTEFKATLTTEQSIAAEKILAQYGGKAMREFVLPGPVVSHNCKQFRPSAEVQMARPSYPFSASHSDQDGVIIMGLTVGVDGLARDPQILAAAPVGIFEKSAIDAILKSRFRPATRNDAPVEYRVSIRFIYSIKDGGVLWEMSAIRKVREIADKGNPSARYLIGLLGILDSTLKIPEESARAMILSAAQTGYAPAQYWVGRQLDFEHFCGNPDKMMRWLQQAAKGGDASAQIEWVEYRLTTQLNDADVHELKALLKSAAISDNTYAIKHAVAILAPPIDTSPAQQLTDKALALSAAQRLKLYNDSLDPQINEVIAAAYAANNAYYEAIKNEEVAIKKARKLYWNTQDMEQRLTAYHEGHRATGDLLAVPPTEQPLPPVKDELPPCKKKSNCTRTPDDTRTPTGSLIPH